MFYFSRVSHGILVVVLMWDDRLMYSLSKRAILPLVDVDDDMEDMERPQLGIFLQFAFEQAQ